MAKLISEETEIRYYKKKKTNGGGGEKKSLVGTNGAQTPVTSPPAASAHSLMIGLKGTLNVCFYPLPTKR